MLLHPCCEIISLFHSNGIHSCQTTLCHGWFEDNQLHKNLLEHSLQPFLVFDTFSYKMNI